MSPYTEAYFQLSQAVSAYQSHPASTIHQDAVLYNFGQAFDAAIQALAEYLETEGVLILNPSPRGILKEAFAAGVLTDGDVWNEMLEARKMLAGFCSRETRSGIARRVADEFSAPLGRVDALTKSPETTLNRPGILSVDPF